MAAYSKPVWASEQFKVYLCSLLVLNFKSKKMVREMVQWIKTTESKADVNSIPRTHRVERSIL